MWRLTVTAAAYQGRGYGRRPTSTRVLLAGSESSSLAQRLMSSSQQRTSQAADKHATKSSTDKDRRSSSSPEYLRNLFDPEKQQARGSSKLPSQSPSTPASRSPHNKEMLKLVNAFFESTPKASDGTPDSRSPRGTTPRPWQTASGSTNRPLEPIANPSKTSRKSAGQSSQEMKKLVPIPRTSPRTNISGQKQQRQLQRNQREPQQQQQQRQPRHQQQQQQQPRQQQQQRRQQQQQQQQPRQLQQQQREPERSQQRNISRQGQHQRQQQVDIRRNRSQNQGSPHFRKDAQRKQQQAGVGLAGPGTKAGHETPLSGFIERLQTKFAQDQRQARLKGSHEKNSAKTPLPKWRLTQPKQEANTNLRDMRRQGSRRRQPRFNSAQSNFMLRGSGRRQGQGAVSKDQTVMLPAYSICLQEVSLLFREKTSVLRTLLRRIGALSAQQMNIADEDLMIDPELMELLALELEVPCERRGSKNVIDDNILSQRRAAAEAEAQAYEALPSRPPVVTVMGHVDHGKTTLMDALRRRAAKDVSTTGKKKKKSKKNKKSKADEKKGNGDVAGTEAGGITQVVSAFQVPLLEEEQGTVTFLDTPGHAAFKAMRQSGSDAADIIVLVVAADDGVSQQTIEIMNFYKATLEESQNGISMVVAMNKIDKPGVNVEESRARIESQLLEHGILVEGMPEGEGYFGPPVQLFPVSALTGEGLDDLVEGLALQSEVMDLRADDTASAEGIIMDARVEKGVGIVADCIIRWGSIRTGDIVVSGANMGKVKVLKSVTNQQVKSSGPSQPVRIVGFDSVPKAGDPIVCVESEEVANDIIDRRKAVDEAETAGSNTSSASSDVELQSSGKDMMNQEWKARLEKKYDMDGEDQDAVLRIPVIVKADADGTLAALRDSLVQIGDESRHNVQIDPIRMGVGAVSASDIQLAKESGACVIGFNLKTDQMIKSQADGENVPILSSDIIYSLLDDAKSEFAKHLPSIDVEVVHGRANVQAVFRIGGIDNAVAGLMVTEGDLHRAQVTAGQGGERIRCQYRVLRKGKEVLQAPAEASSLKHFKEDVELVSRGQECGLSLVGFDDYEEGDTIECFTVEERHEFM